MFPSRCLFNASIAVLVISLLSFLVSDNDVPAGQADVQTRLSFQTVSSMPDITVVLLNWSRFPNVLRIASLLCGNNLQDVVHSVFIWNNSPKKVNKSVVSQITGCPSNRLHVFNSEENLYFQARFMACAQVTTRFCFFQDDDYLIWPEVVRALAARMHTTELPPNRIHLLPPEEMLSSQLRTFRIGDDIHTTFSWLGYGALLRKEEATSFIELLHRLNFTEDQFRMADNYFSILSNTIPELWFDQGVELGGGIPFTVGDEGKIRNNRHIAEALSVLSSIVQSERKSDLPFIMLSKDLTSIPQIWRAPCKGVSCILSTTINLLPGLPPTSTLPSIMEVIHNGVSPDLDDYQIQHFTSFPLSYAVDGNWSTPFRSPGNARKDELILLDMLGIPPESVEGIQIVLQVNQNTEHILRNCELAWHDGEGARWITESNITWHCVTVETGVVNGYGLRECSVGLGGLSLRLTRYNQPRTFRLQLGQDMGVVWEIYEMWIRAMNTR